MHDKLQPKEDRAKPMMKGQTLKLVPASFCEEMACLRAFTQGGWTQAFAETFGLTHKGEETHVHFYTDSLEKAQEIFLDILERLPSTVETFSIQES